MKSSQSPRGDGDKGAVWRLLCRGVFFFYCVNPTATQAIPPADHESILYALRSAGLTSSAAALNAIIIEGGFLVPPSATIFVPTNSAINDLLPTSPNLINLFSYHISTENLPLHVLNSLPIGTQIPSLLPNNTLLVTNNNPSSFSINNEKLTTGDLCTIQTVACYALDAVFNSTTWGKAVVLATPPVLSPAGSPLLPPIGAPIVPPTESPLVPSLAPLPGSPFSPPVGPSPGSPPPPSGAPAPGSPGGVGGAPAPGTNPPGSSPSAAPETENCNKHLMAVVIALLVTTIFV